MANEEHLAILRRGVQIWNQWREDYPGIQPNLSDADLDKGKLTMANLRRASLAGASLAGASLAGASLAGADLHKADLHRTNSRAAIFTEANLSGADLSGSDLSMAIFTEADLSKTNLSGAHCHGAYLHRADLSKADLSFTYLYGAALTGANLHGANLSSTKLLDANLTRANLAGANLIGTDLSRADLTAAKMGWSTLARVDLSQVRELNTVIHEGPSTIGIDTIYHSKGDIPETFLRGAGVPDSMIEFMHSLVRSETAIDFYSCFISYSSRDQAFAQRLHADLQDKGVRCWFAPEDMKTGDRIRPTLDASIRLHDKLLLILSEHSVASDWVEQEVETALARERQEDRTVLFPIRLDDTVMEIDVGWPALIRNTRHIGDFRNWKDHDAYQQAFGRLLRDLKAE